MSITKAEEFSVDVPGGQMYAKRWTPASDSGKSPIILLHESLGSVGLWKNFPAKLAEALCRPVIAYDRLGFGKSDARDSLHSKQFLEEEAGIYFPALKAQLAVTQYVLLGHSVGGDMAAYIAAQDPDCLAVITVSAQAYVDDSIVQGVEKTKLAFQQPGQIERLKKWHGQKASWVLNAWTETWLSDEFRHWSLKPALEQVYCPVLAIHGEDDEYGSSEFPEFIADHAAGQGTALLIKNCGHIPYMEKPKEVICAAKEFLGDVD